jgi:hypothetical protein
MAELKCPVAGCSATAFGSSSQPIPEKLKGTPMALNFKPLRFVHCSNGHVIGLDYSSNFTEIERQIDFLIKKPAPK